ncbi:hypothetical protein ASD65_01885 [Microbacterium sp. Root61]|uniref:hypothetical protein n=1 Tax=Microbacterium sp. Root61 TaxID=1736570 RepID=UPI0006FDA855|nr:hypothetical protein [Microbacterium sp. Root61]KRA23307.1 hypothetical protein ASD65_01885 [Microbacterium sp. Root61]
MKRRHEQQAISEDEQIARYAYLLGNVPASIADKAYAAAFARLSAAQRPELLGQLRSQLPVAPKEPASDDPEAFAVFMRDLYARDALVRVRGAGAFAAEFVASPPIVAYFTAGAGSVAMEQQPLWVQELAGHETAPIDGGRMHHRHGVDTSDLPWLGN